MTSDDVPHRSASCRKAPYSRNSCADTLLRVVGIATGIRRPQENFIPRLRGDTAKWHGNSATPLSGAIGCMLCQERSAPPRRQSSNEAIESRSHERRIENPER